MGNGSAGKAGLGLKKVLPRTVKQVYKLTTEKNPACSIQNDSEMCYFFSS